jgi:hypothetical protein
MRSALWRWRIDEKAMKWLRIACEAGSSTRMEDLSLADPGSLAYDVAELFCQHRQWGLAESALHLALYVAPQGFDRLRFDRLLKGAVSKP